MMASDLTRRQIPKPVRRHCMDFEFSEEQLAFVKEVETFLDANDDPDVFDLTRENMAQIVDTPKRRQFMASLGARGWLGMTWPAEYGGSEGEGRSEEHT